MLTSEEIKQAQIEAIGSAVANNGVIGLVKRRIQNAGADKSNVKLGKSGKYSKSYATKRSDAGYQIGHVDLTFTGKLLGSFTSGTLNKEQVTGFDDPNIRTTTTKEGKTYTARLTDIYNKKGGVWPNNDYIFQLSDNEIEYYNDTFGKICLQIIAKRMQEALQR